MLVVFFMLLFTFFPYGFDFLALEIVDMDLYEFLILALATQRLTRLFVYDSIMQFFRDWFLDLKEVKENGVTYIERYKPTTNVRRLMYDLIACPWCASVWLGLVVVGTYFTMPIFNFLWIVLAVSGVASFLQISINKLGWQAENAKISCLKNQ